MSYRVSPFQSIGLAFVFLHLAGCAGSPDELASLEGLPDTEDVEVVSSPLTMLSPTGTVASTDVTFTWTPDAYTVQNFSVYILGLFTKTYSSTLLGCDVSGDCTTVISIPPGSHTWYVKEGTGKYKGPVSFVVPGTPPPGKATAFSPNGAATTSQVFSWTKADENAVSFTIWSSGNFNRTYDVATLGCDADTVCESPAITLLAGTNSTWFVRGNGAEFAGAWSGPASIVVDGLAVPPAPTNLVPNGTATTSQTFSWTRAARATAYQVYSSSLKINATYQSDALGCQEVGGLETCTIPTAIALTMGASGTWLVRGTNATGGGAWASGSYNVPNLPPTNPPTNLVPASGSVTSPVTFSWTSVQYATSYMLWATGGVINKTYTAAALSCPNVNQTCTIPVPIALTANPSLRWYVKAINTFGSTAFASKLITVL